MMRHLTPTVIEGYVAGTLSDDERVALAEHVGECRVCQELVWADPRLAARLAGLRRRVEDGDAHPEFDTLVGLAERTLDEASRTPVERHVAECAQCAEDLDDLSRARAEMPLRDRRTPAPAGTMIWNTAAWNRYGRPAVAATVVAALAATAWFVTRVGHEHPAAQAASRTPAPLEKFALNDALGRIAVGADGRVTGLGALSSADAALVTAALSTGHLQMSGTLASLQPRASQLMGVVPAAPAFALLGPLGTVVESSTPEFRWAAAPDATTYLVSVFDDRLNLVTDSGPVTLRHWTPPGPLVRDRDYSWQVHAETASGPLLAPGPGVPEARFRVLDAASALALDHARQQYGASHLALGVLDAHLGLLDDATREFTALQQANPASPVAADLVRQIQAARIR